MSYPPARRQIGPIDRFRYYVTAGNPRHCAIEGILAERGFVIEDNARKANALRCVRRIERVYDERGADGLRAFLRDEIGDRK